MEGGRCENKAATRQTGDILVVASASGPSRPSSRSRYQGSYSILGLNPKLTRGCHKPKRSNKLKPCFVRNLLALQAGLLYVHAGLVLVVVHRQVV